MTAPMDGKSRILPLEAFAGLVANEDDVQKFLAQYPHPFLILETKEGDFGDAGFQTLATELAPTPPDPPETRKHGRPGADKGDPLKTVIEEDTIGATTDLDLHQPKTPVASKHEEIKKKLEGARLVTYVCPLVKRDVNKFASMITLGRAANNDIRVNLPSISKFHAYFTHVQSNDSWFLADANSSNGTYVNGERLKGEKNRIRLANGAAVRLGQDVTLRFFDARSFYEFLRQRMRGGATG